VPLFEHALAVTEGKFVAHKGLAVGLLRAGNLERAHRLGNRSAVLTRALAIARDAR